MESFDVLRTFRRSFYECLHRRKDALFELTDAILSTDAAAPSPVHLSLQPAHRRGWASLYAALLSHGRIDAEVLRELLVRHPLAGRGATPVYAVDTSVWPRCDAECSPERGYYYHPSRHSAGQPIVACSEPTSSSHNGQGCSILRGVAKASRIEGVNPCLHSNHTSSNPYGSSSGFSCPSEKQTIRLAVTVPAFPTG
jgi:DDE superfamily endonuclease